jgi:hypothetical protein
MNGFFMIGGSERLGVEWDKVGFLLFIENNFFIICMLLFSIYIYRFYL